MRSLHHGLVGVALVLAAAALVCSTASAQSVDLLSGLKSGQIWAQFQGDGPSSVVGVLGRAPGGPTQVVIPAGTTFQVAALPGPGAALNQYGGGGFAQYGQGGGGAYGQYGGGIRQAMFTPQSNTVSLAFADTARVVLPTVCMDYGKPEPRPTDVMVAFAPKDPHLVRLAQASVHGGYPNPAVQLAMWAYRSDLSASAADRYLLQVAPGESRAAEAKRGSLLSAAASLMSAAGLAPTNYRMFR